MVCNYPSKKKLHSLCLFYTIVFVRPASRIVVEFFLVTFMICGDLDDI